MQHENLKKQVFKTWNIVHYLWRRAGDDEWVNDSHGFDNYIEIGTEFEGICDYANWIQDNVPYGYLVEIEDDNEIVVYKIDGDEHIPVEYYSNFEFYHDYEKCWEDE